MNHVNPPPFIRALFAPVCYDHAVAQVRLIETHISWVLLTGDYAYKIKKPVNLGFLDFSTLALRRQACLDEVRLNRRLAPELYLGVASITGSSNTPHVSLRPDMIGSEPSEPFEYAVKMRQFPSGATLDHLDERGELCGVQVDQLAARLAKFHFGECQSAAPDSLWGEPDAIAQPVKDNFRLLAEHLPSPSEIRLLEKLRDWSFAEHERLAPLMRERKRDGLIRECHGDLHLGNLAWVNSELLIFDCIEFSPALRWIDVISEVAFCFMDLLHRQHTGLAMRFLNAWLEAGGDYAGVALLRYYAVYRAMVRAKVAALRAGQTGDEDTESKSAEVGAYLQLAERLAQEVPVQLCITHGFSGSGKTTLTQSLLEKQGMIRLRSDVERKRLAGLDALARSGNEIGGGLYTQEAGRRTYAHLGGLSERLLEAGWPVMVDAAFLERGQRDLFRKIAQQHEIPFHILDIQIDHATLRERIALRASKGKDASEADLRVLQHQIETTLPLDVDELPDVTVIKSPD